MDLSSYKKQICITMNDRDFWSFVETEGEVWIENNVLHLNIRANNPMTDEKGKYVHSTYEIIEYFEDNEIIKVKYEDFVNVFDLKSAGFCKNTDYFILENEKLDLSDVVSQKEIIDFLMYILAYLYQIDKYNQDNIRNILSQQWTTNEYKILDLAHQIQMKIKRWPYDFCFHQFNNQYYFSVNYSPISKKRLVFNFYAGYFVPQLKQHFLSFLLNYKNWELL